MVLKVKPFLTEDGQFIIIHLHSLLFIKAFDNLLGLIELQLIKPLTIEAVTLNQFFIKQMQ